MKLSKKYFNMVEIVLALAVVSIAIVSLMGVLPVALRASKNSVSDNAVATVAEIMKAYVDNQYNNYTGALSNFYSFGGFGNLEDTLTTNTTFFATPATTIFGVNNPMEIYNLGNNGLFRVELYSGDLSNTSTRITDFSAGVQIWQETMNGSLYCYMPQRNNETVSDSIISGTSGTDLTQDPPQTDNEVITMVMRISYPADASYQNQEHRYYKFDYFRK